MSSAFTAQLRTGGTGIQLASGPGTITIRVEAAEIWETIRVVAKPDTPLSLVKQKALAAMLPDADFTDDYVFKLRGWEMLDHHATLAESGVVDGSILLLAHRRRRPVR